MDDLQNIKPIHLGSFNQICENCNALYFASEATKREKIYTSKDFMTTILIVNQCVIHYYFRVQRKITILKLIFNQKKMDITLKKNIGFENFTHHDSDHCTGKYNNLTAKQYAAYRLMVRDDSSEDKNLVDSLFYSGRKLFQQYIHTLWIHTLEQKTVT